MTKKVNIKQERALLISFGCTEQEVIEYFLIFRDLQTPNFSLESWKLKNQDFIAETLKMLKNEYVSIPRDLSRFLRDKGKKNAIKLKRRKPISDLRKSLYFFIKSRKSTSIELMERFLSVDLNIPLSDAKRVSSEMRFLNISGYTLVEDSFVRNSEKSGVDGIRIDIVENAPTIDFTEDNITIGRQLLDDPSLTLALLPLLSKTLEEDSNIVEYAQNIYTTFIGLKYGNN